MMTTFNKTYKFHQVMGDLSQEEIINTPEYFAMGVNDIVNHISCPDHLRRVLMGFRWSERPNVVQVRVQDFRARVPKILGAGWHVDVETYLVNGMVHRAKNLSEFRSQTVSFGDVVETEFVKGPVEIDTEAHDPFNHVGFASYVASIQPHTVKAKPNQLCEYTAFDIHRMAHDYRFGRARLIIVSFDCDEAIPKDGGEVRPSLREKAVV